MKYKRINEFKLVATHIDLRMWILIFIRINSFIHGRLQMNIYIKEAVIHLPKCYLIIYYF